MDACRRFTARHGERGETVVFENRIDHRPDGRGALRHTTLVPERTAQGLWLPLCCLPMT